MVPPWPGGRARRWAARPSTPSCTPSASRHCCGMRSRDQEWCRSCVACGCGGGERAPVLLQQMLGDGVDSRMNEKGTAIVMIYYVPLPKPGWHTYYCLPEYMLAPLRRQQEYVGHSCTRHQEFHQINFRYRRFYGTALVVLCPGLPELRQPTYPCLCQDANIHSLWEE
jgi:hypothetical protein